jgi:hypothetical protein
MKWYLVRHRNSFTIPYNSAIKAEVVNYKQGRNARHISLDMSDSWFSKLCISLR